MNTNYLDNKMLDHVWGKTTYTAATTVYFGLSTSAANKSGTVAEPSGNNYARVSMTNNTTNFPNASSGNKATGAAVTFGAPSGSWGTIKSVFIADASSGGNVLVMADITAVALDGSSPAPSIALGAFTFAHS